MNYQKISGIMLFWCGAIVLMGIITAEAMYPSGYTTNLNEISDLGGTKPPNSLVYQPSAFIFNTTFLLSGLMVLIATYFQHRHFKKFIFSIPMFLFGLGLLGIGAFPGDKAPYHGLASMLTFLAGGLSPIMSYKVVSSPFKFTGFVCGLLALAMWFIIVFSPEVLLSFMGIGLIERWIAYPIMLWLIGFGGYLMNGEKEKQKFKEVNGLEKVQG
jgi:hypothetical membrane protein